MTAGAQTAIIGLAHGSRHPGVRGPIDALMTATSELVGLPARAAYLDLTEPDLQTVGVQLTQAGVHRAIVIPLLFTNAYHARIDAPSTIAAAADGSGIELVAGGILGTGDDVLAVVETAMADAGIADDLPVLLYAVGSSDPAANAAVRAFALRLAARRGTPALAAFGTTDPRPETMLADLTADGPVGIVPLFVAPGLLLDPLVHLARDRSYPITPPLGRRLAGVVAARAADALG